MRALSEYGHGITGFPALIYSQQRGQSASTRYRVGAVRLLRRSPHLLVIAVRICTTVQSSALETICSHKWFLRRVGSGMMRQAMPKAKAI